jgi:hypothetical protein
MARLVHHGRRPTNDDIKYILKVVRPENIAGIGLNARKRHIDECRAEAIGIIEAIKSHRPSATPGVVKDQLLKVEAKLRAARTAINESSLANQLHADDLVRELDRVIQECEKSLRQMQVKPSGGAGGRLIAEQKKMAAELAFDLMLDRGTRPPTLTRNGNYNKLASRLFEIATGRQSSDMERACTRVFEDLEEDGFPRAGERRRIVREGKSSWKEMPKELLELMNADSRQTAKK